MFLISTKEKEGKKDYVEGQKIIDAKGNKKNLTWDDLPKNIKISVLQLLYPFPVKFKGSEKPITPKLTISDFDKYYFFNEATVPFLVQGDKVIREGVAKLEAKTIAGIDETAKIVLELRMDKWGNCTVKKFPLKQLQGSIKAGLFRGEIIRDGAR